jgi:hypothetical protein
MNGLVEGEEKFSLYNFFSKKGGVGWISLLQ